MSSRSIIWARRGRHAAAERLSAHRSSDRLVPARFIKDVRSRSLDPVLMRGDWLQAYDFVSPRGAPVPW
jgi:type IV secretory pathway TrbF-like protein